MYTNIRYTLFYLNTYFILYILYLYNKYYKYLYV